MNCNLLILGAGQYGHVVKEIASSMKCFDKIGFLDDTNKTALGKLSDYEKYAGEYANVFVAFGDAELRMRWIEKTGKTFLNVALLVSPFAHISPSVVIRRGCVVEPMSVVGTNAELSTGVIVSAGAVIGHDAFIGDCCHIDCGAVVSPNSLIPAGTHIRCGETAKREMIKTAKTGNNNV